MKEKGINKIIELLNEYGEYDLVEHNGEICKWDTNDEGEINIYTDYTNNIISKKFGFIKWLVDNDKIFLGDIALKVYDLDLRAGKHTYTEYPIYESLLMLLSIQDNPIEFLVSILK